MKDNKWLNLIKVGIEKLLSKKDKKEILENINKYNLSFDDKCKFIKSLSKELKTETLENIFNFYNTYSFSVDEVFMFFNKLSILDKGYIINRIYDNYNLKLLINLLSHNEKIYVLLNCYLSDKCKQIIFSMLDVKDRIKLYKRMNNNINYYDTDVMLKYLPEQYIREIFIKEKFPSESKQAKLLTYLSDDLIKLECLKFPNRYNLKLSHLNKVEVIMSLSSKVKNKFLLEDKYYDVELDQFDKEKILLSMSDERKIYYLYNQNKYKNIIFYDRQEIFSSFTSDFSKLLIKNRLIYDLNIDNNDIIILINNLDVTDRLEFLFDNNQFNINLSLDEKCLIIAKLPIQYQLEIIKPDNKYGLEFSSGQIINIISFMNRMNIINILVLYNSEKNNLFPVESIWKFVEALKPEDAKKLMSSSDDKVRSFVQKYKVSFVKCLYTSEKLDIIFNKGLYNIYLDDNKKIKILKSISMIATIKNIDNVFNYFDDITVVTDYFLKNKKEFDKLNDTFKIQLITYFMGKEVNEEEISLCLKIFQNVTCGYDVLVDYNQIKLFFNRLGISLVDFIQYGINSNKYNWYMDVKSIISNNDVEEFELVKNYFFGNYYNDKSDSKNVIKNFLEILDSYNKYKELCVKLTFEGRNLDRLEKDDIKFLFNSNVVLNVSNLNDISDIRTEKIKAYTEIANNSSEIRTVRNALIELFFGIPVLDFVKILNYTGVTEDFKILEFNNREHKELKSLFEDVILLTSFVERILNSTDIEGMKATLLKYSSEENIIHTKKIFNYCSRYEEYVRKLYECEFMASLTKVDFLDNDLMLTEYAKNLSRKYGGKVFDLSNNQYVLAAHVMSRQENISDLVNGVSTGKNNFICLSPVSHRGQNYYYNWRQNKTIFAYDTILDDSFICSSINNMGSNYSLRYNSSEVPNLNRTQKGILETSQAVTGNNAEVLCFREGLKPCGIIIPKGTEPSEEAILCHKEYKLPFIITQEENQIINNPLKLSDTSNNLNIENVDNYEISNLLNNITFDNNNKRRIAVLTDSHALYEPTLACLCDIRKKGITEIYSLGDNIGHGPNPKEVLDLLSEYNVNSVYGNHELYFVIHGGVSLFKEHFPSDESYERTYEMNKWMKSQVSLEQVDEISKYPERYEIKIDDNSNLVLIHTNRAYNSSGFFSSAPVINEKDIVIRGHEHFEKDRVGNVITIRAVGIGQQNEDDGMASYEIITFDNGKIDVKNVKLYYNRDNLLHTINESDMPVSAKKLIKSWVFK